MMMALMYIFLKILSDQLSETLFHNRSLLYSDSLVLLCDS